MEDPQRVRAAAGKKLLVSSWALLAVPVIVYLTETLKGHQPLLQAAVFGGAFLCAPFLMHLLELVIGVPFIEISNRWDGLTGWQRGVVGVTGCGFLILLIILVMGTVLPLLH